MRTLSIHLSFFERMEEICCPALGQMGALEASWSMIRHKTDRAISFHQLTREKEERVVILHGKCCCRGEKRANLCQIRRRVVLFSSCGKDSERKAPPIARLVVYVCLLNGMEEKKYVLGHARWVGGRTGALSALQLMTRRTDG